MPYAYSQLTYSFESRIVSNSLPNSIVVPRMTEKEMKNNKPYRNQIAKFNTANAIAR